MRKPEQIARAMIVALEAQEKAGGDELYVCVYDERDVTVDGQVDFASLARAAVEAMADTSDETFMARVSSRVHAAKSSVSGEEYPVLRSTIRSLADAILNEKDAG